MAGECKETSYHVISTHITQHLEEVCENGYEVSTATSMEPAQLIAEAKSNINIPSIVSLFDESQQTRVKTLCEKIYADLSASIPDLLKLSPKNEFEGVEGDFNSPLSPWTLCSPLPPTSSILSRNNFFNSSSGLPLLSTPSEVSPYVLTGVVEKKIPGFLSSNEPSPDSASPTPTVSSHATRLPPDSPRLVFSHNRVSRGFSLTAEENKPCKFPAYQHNPEAPSKDEEAYLPKFKQP